MSRKHKGADSILRDAVIGTLVDSGVLVRDSWYKIKAQGETSAIPDYPLNSAFKTPYESGDAITLGTGDEVWPLTFTDVCKVDVEMSGEMGVIETTDSCDYPYVTSLPDGFTNFSGTINTMLRFDDATDELVDQSEKFMNKFYNVDDDDGEGTYTHTPADDSDLYIFILMNKDSESVVEKYANFLIMPIILNSIANNFALKDVEKADYGWTKGQGPAQLYKRLTPAAS